MKKEKAKVRCYTCKVRTPLKQITDANGFPVCKVCAK